MNSFQFFSKGPIRTKSDEPANNIMTLLEPTFKFKFGNVEIINLPIFWEVTDSR